MIEKETMAGSLSFMSLADIFQIFGGNRSTGVLHVRGPHREASGKIYFLKGNPINAVNGPLRGIDAIYPLFGWMEGRFEFHEEKVEEGRRVRENRMKIILNALKMMDGGLIKKVGATSRNDRGAK